MHGAKTIMKEEGVLALYKGLMPTMLRQSSNQVCVRPLPCC